MSTNKETEHTHTHTQYEVQSQVKFLDWGEASPSLVFLLSRVSLKRRQHWWILQLSGDCDSSQTRSCASGKNEAEALKDLSSLTSHTSQCDLLVLVSVAHSSGQPSAAGPAASGGFEGNATVHVSIVNIFRMIYALIFDIWYGPSLQSRTSCSYVRTMWGLVQREEVVQVAFWGELRRVVEKF